MSSQIPLVDLHAQYEPLKEEIHQAWDQILDSMRLFLGPSVQAFEQEFAAYCGVPHAVGVSDGTTALNLALRACGVGPGDEVITVSHTFIATVEAILLVGAKPVFVDIDPQTYTIDVNQIESRLTSKTKVILPVHLYGQCADMHPIMQLADRHGLYVIEDACQAHRAEYDGRKAGGLGSIAAFSFYYSKNLGAYGEAGMVTTRDEGLATRVRMLRDHGSKQRYHHEIVGLNGRLDELQAAVLRIKLHHLDAWNERRRQNAALYRQLLEGSDLIVPFEAPYGHPVYHLYVVRTRFREALQRWLAERGIGTGVHYPIPCHLQPACDASQYAPGSLPITEAVAAEVLSLPMYPELEASQIERVASEIQAFFSCMGQEPEPLTGARSEIGRFPGGGSD
jgi:dTDP-4-amino-4,6-dideoxygalactose transaminase